MLALVAQDQRATRVTFGAIRDYPQNALLLRDTVAEMLAQEVAFENVWRVQLTRSRRSRPTGRASRDLAGATAGALHSGYPGHWAGGLRAGADDTPGTANV